MKWIHQTLKILCLSLLLLHIPASFAEQPPPDETDREVISLLKAQNARLSRDLRLIQREIAALRAQLEAPDIKDAFAGVGYIFGFFGIAAFFAARRKG